MPQKWSLWDEEKKLLDLLSDLTGEQGYRHRLKSSISNGFAIRLNEGDFGLTGAHTMLTGAKCQIVGKWENGEDAYRFRQYLIDIVSNGWCPEGHVTSIYIADAGKISVISTTSNKKNDEFYSLEMSLMCRISAPINILQKDAAGDFVKDANGRVIYE